MKQLWNRRATAYYRGSKYSWFSNISQFVVYIFVVAVALQVKVVSFVDKIFVLQFSTMKTTNTRPHESYPLYSILHIVYTVLRLYWYQDNHSTRCMQFKLPVTYREGYRVLYASWWQVLLTWWRRYFSNHCLWESYHSLFPKGSAQWMTTSSGKMTSTVVDTDIITFNSTPQATATKLRIINDIFLPHTAYPHTAYAQAHHSTSLTFDCYIKLTTVYLYTFCTNWWSKEYHTPENLASIIFGEWAIWT